MFAALKEISFESKDRREDPIQPVSKKTWRSSGPITFKDLILLGAQHTSDGSIQNQKQIWI